MSQREQGMVYAFRLSGSRMRQSAAQLRRQGQTLDALALVRRAAEQEDTASAWQALAAELRASGNWEAAARILARVLSRESAQPGAWVDMARCMQALGQDAVAVDCAYHQLQEDPWSPEGDAARAILASLENVPDRKEPFRTQRLIHRGLTAWQQGERSLGERRIRRALRIAADRPRLLVTTAMMCMLEMDFDGALRYLPRALRLEPDDPRTLTALSTLYQQQGKRRLARGLLAKAGQCADAVLAEDGFLTAAWAQDAWPELQTYLDRRRKRTPHRIPLLSAAATMHSELEDNEAARDLWREIIAIDPDDRNASTMLAASQGGGAEFFAVPGMLPRTERQRQMAELQRAAERLSLGELLRPGSRERRLMDWFVASDEAAERRLAMKLLEGGAEEVIPYLKELLCQPFLRFDTRQWALIRLAELGYREEMLLLAGDHYSLVACRPIAEREAQHPWRSFLPELLKLTRRTCRSADMAAMAAQIWKRMSPEERAYAANAGALLWAKAMEVYFLSRAEGDEELALRAMQDTPVSLRRVRRVLRRINRYMTE